MGQIGNTGVGKIEIWETGVKPFRHAVSLVFFLLLLLWVFFLLLLLWVFFVCCFWLVFNLV